MDDGVADHSPPSRALPKLPCQTPETPPKRGPLPAPPSPTPETPHAPKRGPLPARPSDTTDTLSKRGPLPNLPALASSLPEPPRSITIHYNDYGDIFYGLWDCEAGKDHELSFRSGDMIHVVDKLHENAGWWTGYLDGKTGLVPKSYLIPAYVLA